MDDAPSGFNSPAPALPQLLFIHGSGGSADSWYYQTKDLRGTDALTLPGHEAALALPPPPSSPPIPASLCPSVADCAEYVAEYIDYKHYAPGNVVTVGHSLGGAIALQHALRHSEQLAGLVLVGTGARLRVRPELLEALANDYAAGVEMLIEGYFGADADRQLMLGTRRKLLRLPSTVALHDFSICNQFDLMSEVQNIKLPTLLIFGSDDPLTPPKYGEWLAAHMPHARLEIVPSSGHMFPLTQPAAVNRLIRGFIADLKAKQEGRLN